MGSWQLGPVVRAIRGHRAAALLVVVQLGVGLALAVLAVLIGDYFIRQGQMVSDFAEDQLVLIHVQLPGRGASGDALAARRAALVAEIAATPGCTGAAPLQPLPLGVIDRDPDLVRLAPGDPPIRAYSLDGGAGLARVAGLRLRAGRDLVAGDLGGSTTAAVISAGLAEQLWPGHNPIGARLVSRANGRVVVVGVVDDMRTRAFGPELPAILYGRDDTGSPQLAVLARAAPDGGRRLATALRERLRRPGLHAQVTTVAREARRRAAPVAAVVGILTIMVGTIVLVILIGSMGLTYFLVSVRTREIGVRRALGATRRDVVRHFLLENAVLTAAGAGLGLAITAATLPLLITAQRDFEVRWPLVMVAVAGLVVLDLIATWIPARRAAAVPPVVASRTT